MKPDYTPDEYKTKDKVKRIVSIEHREKISEALKGKKLSPERIEKMRISSIGRIKSPETCKRISENKKGWSPSKETRKKMSEGQIASQSKPKSIERRRKVSEMLRYNIGEKNSKAILTELIVINIIKYLNEGKQDLEIQKLIGVDRKNISQIKHRKSWVYLTNKLLDDSKLYRRVDKKLTSE